jgi:hypothetical protein
MVARNREKKGRRRDSGRRGDEKPLMYSRFYKNLDALGEKRNRENNRPITGAHQGDIRRGNRTPYLSP